MRHVSGSTWTRFKPGAIEGSALTSWLAYGRPVYAMASGTVVGCWRNAPDNSPGSSHPLLLAQKFAGGGNHLWILQDNGVTALYAHFRPGSIDASICPHNAVQFTGVQDGFQVNPDIEGEVVVTSGAHVTAGQKLGEIGNSGASSEPHLHVHMELNGQPVAMPFERGMTTPMVENNSILGTANIGGPWTRLAGGAMPQTSILLWPPRPMGNYTFKGTKNQDYQILFEHLSDSGLMPDLVSCEKNGLIYNSTWIPNKPQWAHLIAMNSAKANERNQWYTSQGYTRTSSYTCGNIQTAVWRK